MDVSTNMNNTGHGQKQNKLEKIGMPMAFKSSKKQTNLFSLNQDQKLAPQKSFWEIFFFNNSSLMFK